MKLKGYTSVIIKLEDVNDNTPDLAIPNIEDLKVLENSKGGTLVFKATAEDRDQGPNGVVSLLLTFSLVFVMTYMKIVKRKNGHLLIHLIHIFFHNDEHFHIALHHSAKKNMLNKAQNIFFFLVAIQALSFLCTHFLLLSQLHSVPLPFSPSFFQGRIQKFFK